MPSQLAFGYGLLDFYTGFLEAMFAVVNESKFFVLHTTFLLCRTGVLVMSYSPRNICEVEGGMTE